MPEITGDSSLDPLVVFDSHARGPKWSDHRVASRLCDATGLVALFICLCSAGTLVVICYSNIPSKANGEINVYNTGSVVGNGYA